MITEDQLCDYTRMLMRDRGEKNFLLNYVAQFSKDEILRAAELAAMKYGVMTPPSLVGINWQQIPDYLAILGAVMYLLSSEAFLQLRNQASMSTDDMEMVGIDDKWAQYLQLKSDVANEWEGLAKSYKISQNAEQFYGSIPSGYRNIGRNYT